MNIRNEKPPIWEEASKLFNLSEKETTFFTYGNTLYNPSGHALTADLIKHEEMHAEQQSYSDNVAHIWWQRYLADTDFRLAMEAEAYGAQYKFICANVKDRNKQAGYLRGFATHLSSSMYGNIIPWSEAVRLIKLYATGADLEGIEAKIPDDSEVI